MYQKIYINVIAYLCLNIKLNNYVQKKENSIQICKLGNALNANEVCPGMLIRKCLLAMLILMLVILMPILMLLNLNTGYADADANYVLVP